MCTWDHRGVGLVEQAVVARRATVFALFGWIEAS